VARVVDGTQIPISKPKVGTSHYYYFKLGGYTMNCQVVVDNSKQFLDLYIGMPGSTNDVRMLWRSTLFNCKQRQILGQVGVTFRGFSPHLIGNLGFPLLPWLMTHARVVVENAFGLLKLSFHELHVKSDLDVAFILDVVMCYAILYNLLLKNHMMMWNDAYKL